MGEETMIKNFRILSETKKKGNFSRTKFLKDPVVV